MRPFSILLKPVGSACNLSCKYCFYLEHERGVMSKEVLERLVSSYCELPFSGKSIALQGGEPLLAPSYIFDIISSAPIIRSIQTNATLITQDFAERFARGSWLVGASIDGPEDLHKKMRGESFQSAVNGIRLLEKANVDYNLLTVVSKANVSEPERLYRFLRDNFQTRFHQYIECTGPYPEFAISGEEWGEFLVRLFDEWRKEDSRVISIRLFDSIVSSLFRGYPTQCSFSDACDHYLVVDFDGAVYPCDFFVEKSLRLGNIMENSWQEILLSPKYLTFANAKRSNLSAKCLNCPSYALCKGDCPRNRLTLCKGWQRFFNHAAPILAKML